MTENTLLTIGLPESGKTTFLAALWHVAESEEVAGALKLERLSDEIQHLNMIKNDWLLCQKVGRSNLANAQFPTLWLKDPSNGAAGKIVFPDLDGELFRDQWKAREWSLAYDEIVRKIDRILLFIHPDKVIEPITVQEVQRLSTFSMDRDTSDPLLSPAVRDYDLSVLDDGDQQDGPPTVEWDLELAPTQVQLVGLLQFLEPYVAARSPIRLAIIVSAWDQVLQKSGEVNPAAWIPARMPYLDQYLKSHFEMLTVRVYGVSAQGGDLTSDVVRLSSISPASNRIIVRGVDCTPHDITEPVRWALGWRE